MHYKIHLRQLVGEKKAAETIKNALFILSFGTNDFIQNYFEEPIRPKQFTVEQYQNYLISRMFRAIKVFSLSLSLCWPFFFIFFCFIYDKSRIK